MLKAKLKLKEITSSSANKWLAKNRSLVLRQTPIWAQSLITIVISLAGITVAASIIFKIDEVITVSGQLTSMSGSTDVKTPVGGKVIDVFVKDGQFVEKGQLLMRFDTTQASAQKATVTRLINLEQKDAENRSRIYMERRSVIEKKLSTAQIVSKELQFLVETGGYQRMQYLRQQDEIFELQSQLSNIDLEMSRSQLEASKSLDRLKTELKQAELQLQYQNVIAPVSGIVFESQAAPEGVLPAGEAILTIVPQEGLKGEVLVSNKDIGFVQPGMKAKVRVDAFPFTRYGELLGKVSQIGADALPPDQLNSFYRFPVKLDLNKNYLESKGTITKLRSGLAITANLKLREKRVISLLSDLLVDQTEGVKTIRQQ